MEYIKICGLKQPEDIELCIEKGAQAIGFIYNVPKSPRNLERNEINRLISLIKGKIITVGVIIPDNIENLIKMMNEINVDLFQVHLEFEIDELINLSIDLKKKIIIAIKLTSENLESTINKINKSKDHFFAFLVDNSQGKGKNLDPLLVKELFLKTKNAKIILAGGIDIDNVDFIMKNFKVYGIDVSSSLESERGVKDPLKITKFLEYIEEIKNRIKSEN